MRPLGINIITNEPERDNISINEKTQDERLNPVCRESSKHEHGSN